MPSAEIEIFEAEVVDLARIESIEIDVIKRHTRARVLLHERERRAGHVLGVCADPLGQASHERGLPRPEIPEEQDDVAGVQACGQGSRPTAIVSSSDAVISFPAGRALPTGFRHD